MKNCSKLALVQVGSFDSFTKYKESIMAFNLLYIVKTSSGHYLDTLFRSVVDPTLPYFM